MSLFTDASLVYVPSGVKDGKTYSIKPTDGSGDLTFSRGSDIEATRVSANGYIEKAKVNLLLQSNNFSTSWAPTSATLTSGQSGYDGTSDAWLFTSTANYARITQSAGQSGVLTFSAYLKAGTTDWAMLRLAGTGYNITQYFDLTNGVIGSLSGISASINSVGGGWYRCEVTANALASVSSYIYSALGDGDLLVTNETIYIQDAQLNYGLVAQTYQETTTAAVVTGITDNMPRLNYDPANPTCPSLLLEKSSTNEIPNSEYLSAWGASNVSVTQNTATSPEGVQNASTIEVTTQTASQGLAQGFVADGTSYYTISGYYKKTATSQRAQLKIRDFLGSGTTYGFVDLDLSSGSVLASIGTYSVTSFNSDWWYIQVATASVPSAGIRRAVIRLDNQTVGTQITAYGIMVEKGTYATSYIPTYGASATRLQDVSKAIYNPIAGLTQATLMVEYTQPIARPSGLNHIAGYRDNANADFYILQIGNSDSHELRWRGQNGTAVSLAVNIPEATYGLNRKVAFVKTNDKLIGYCNGVKLAEVSDGATNAFSTDTAEELDLWYSGFVETKNIKQLLLFPTALSDADAIALTA